MVFELMPTCKRVLFGHVMELFGLVVLFDPTIAWDTRSCLSHLIWVRDLFSPMKCLSF